MICTVVGAPGMEAGLNALVGQFDENGAVRKGQGSRPDRVDSDRVAENGAKLVQWRRFLGRCDEFPLPVAAGDGNAVDGRSVCCIGAAGD